MGKISLISGSRDSNITDGGYGYDMVVAVTQGAINNALKTYFYHMEQDSFVEAYDEAGMYIDYKKVLKAMNPNIPPSSPDYVDLFNVDPDHTTKREKEAIEAAKKIGMKSAMRGRLGWPKGMLPAKMHNSVDLKTGNGKEECLYYYAYFAECEPLVIGENDKKEAELVHYVQPIGNPWVLTYLAYLNLEDKIYKDLPNHVQIEMKEAHPEVTDFDNMFSIQALTIKFSSAVFAASPKDFPGGETYKKYVENTFIWAYKNAIVRAGGVSLGYTLKEKNHVSNSSVIRPTDYDFCISEFSDPNKNDLYALNYLVMLDNKPLPEKRMPFRWNWVDEGNSIDGVMAVSRGKIYELLKEKFEPYINELSLEPKVSVEIDDPTTGKFSYGMKHVNANLKYSEVPAFGFPSAQKCLECNYRSYKDSHDTFLPIWGNMANEYTVSSSIKVAESSGSIRDVIRFETRVKSWFHINFCGSVSEGIIFDYTLSCDIRIKVDLDGKIRFEPGDMSEKDNGTNFKINGWPRIFTTGFDDLIKDSLKYIRGKISDAVSKYHDTFMKDIEGTKDWLFPGMNTFIFQNIEFSKWQDLTAELHFTTTD